MGLFYFLHMDDNRQTSLSAPRFLARLFFTFDSVTVKRQLPRPQIHPSSSPS